MILQVSKYFSEIFKKLAPYGHAVLVMKKGDMDQVLSQFINPEERCISITALSCVFNVVSCRIVVCGLGLKCLRWAVVQD